MTSSISALAPTAPPLAAPRPRRALRLGAAGPAAILTESRHRRGAGVVALRQVLIDAVPDALLARPYDQVTFAFVAQLAGVTPADVRRCFATKAEMVLTALRRPPAFLSAGGALAGSGAEIVMRWLEFWECGRSRYVLLQEPLASADHETIAAWAGPALDCSLRDVLGGAPAPSAPAAPSRAARASAVPTLAG